MQMEKAFPPGKVFFFVEDRENAQAHRPFQQLRRLFVCLHIDKLGKIN